MDNTQATAVLSYIKSLWPDWKPEEPLERLWLKEIQRFDDSVIRTAITEFKPTPIGSRKHPNLSELLNIAEPKQARIQSWTESNVCVDTAFSPKKEKLGISTKAVGVQR